MPTGYYWPQYCTSTATTTNYYVPNTWGNSTAITTSQYQANTNQWYQPLQTVNNYADQIWQQWVIMGNSTMASSPNYSFRQVTPEEAQRVRVEREREAQERRVACVRARTLLEGFLNDEQKVELERQGRFHVTGSKGRRYCIRASGQSGNVDLLKPDGSLQAQLCAHPRGYLPDGDAWLMQMMEIRHDEDHFLRTANVHRGRLPALV